MENCLSIKYKGEFENNNLPTLDTVRIDYLGNTTSGKQSFLLFAAYAPVKFTFKKPFTIGGSSVSTYTVQPNQYGTSLGFTYTSDANDNTPVEDMVVIEGTGIYSFGMFVFWGSLSVNGEKSGEQFVYTNQNIKIIGGILKELSVTIPNEASYVVFGNENLNEDVLFSSVAGNNVEYLKGNVINNISQILKIDSKTALNTKVKFLDARIRGNVKDIPKNTTYIMSPSSILTGSIEELVSTMNSNGRTEGTIGFKNIKYTGLLYNNKTVSQAITDGDITVVSNVAYLHWSGNTITWLSAKPSPDDDYKGYEPYQWWSKINS